MRASTDRILTTHVGSLPRGTEVAKGLFAIDEGEAVDLEQHEAAVKREVGEIVQRQVDAGVDIVSDGEISKISYATYIKHRLTGFEGDSPRQPPRDLEAFPGFMARLASSGGTPSYSRPKCVGQIDIKDTTALETDLTNFRAALESVGQTDAFMNSASPGVIALFQPNEFYESHETYLYAIADAMRHEYEAIVDAGFLLQLDSPDLGLGRHMMFKDKDDAEYEMLARLHIDALNHAVRDIPADRMRLHVCWGNYEGPHTFDAPMEQVLPIALRARPQALVFESSNPRHGHEWRAFAGTDIPDDKILVPGVIDSTTNFVEHPRYVADRIIRFADLVGRERVIAGTDCGFSTFAGFGAVDPDIAFAKLASLTEGSAIASEELW
ncbi:MAG: cobalamin-independent methionine synthase II family protein [Acidobacteria bacterium]|nr:cobalamin-independent methionine synthase II family protein [Acidobacteriota bacterium]